MDRPFSFNIINKSSGDFCVLFAVVDSQSKHLASASEPFTNHRLERIRLLLYGRAVSASISGAASVLPLCPLKINTSSVTESDLIKHTHKKKILEDIRQHLKPSFGCLDTRPGGIFWKCCQPHGLQHLINASLHSGVFLEAPEKNNSDNSVIHNNMLVTVCLPTLFS